MLRLSVFIVCCILSFSVRFQAEETNAYALTSEMIKHEVSIKHPGEKEAIKGILVQIPKANGMHNAYYMDVESVICHLDYCKVIPVRIFWDDLGVFQKYTLKKGATLEKYKDDVFDDEDYIKLTSIMSNQKSPYKDVFIDEIIRVVDTNDDVDAYSGETAIVFDPKETVAGAALTCFTLWHWANNNDVKRIINTITSQSASEEQLINFLSASKKHASLSVQQAIKRRLYTPAFITAVTARVLTDNSIINTVIDYIEHGSSSAYSKTIKKLVNEGNEAVTIAALKSLRKQKHSLPNSFFDELCLDTQILESYPVLSNYLDLMTIQNPNSEIITKQIIPLLEGSFINARAVYWFLSNQKLSKSHQKKLDLFYNANSAKL
jgi:hypothetical protein